MRAVQTHKNVNVVTMKIMFVGNVEIGHYVLDKLYKSGYRVVGVVTSPIRFSSKIAGFVDFAPVAKKNQSILIRTADINQLDVIDRIKRINPDLIIVCGWQRLLGKEVLKIPRLGAIGFHSSLLPKYRGRAPVNWAIINGEKKTGVTMFYCEPEADTGDIIGQKSFSVTLDDTCRSVYAKSACAAVSLLLKYLPKIEKGSVLRKKNFSSNYHFWPKRSPEDGKIDWNSNALKVHNWVRALTHPYPGAFTYYDGKKYFIWGSRFSKNRAKGIGKPGEILRINHKNNNFIELLVGTLDKPISIFNLSSKQHKLPLVFERGKCFI